MQSNQRSMSRHNKGDKIERDLCKNQITFTMAVAKGKLLDDFNEVKTACKTCGLIKQLKKLQAIKIDQGDTSVIKILYNRKIVKCFPPIPKTNLEIFLVETDLEKNEVIINLRQYHW